jgi:hypothetical protein
MSTSKDTQINFAAKLKSAGWGIALFFMAVSMFQTCGLSRKVDKLNKEIQQVATKAEIDSAMQIEGLRTSKRMLYDNNAIIRTTVRPDDRMNEYDAEIKKLQGK